MRRLEDEESDDEGTGENATEDREAIANTLFDMSDNVSYILSFNVFFLGIICEFSFFASIFERLHVPLF